jgi:hypothetical protein
MGRRQTGERWRDQLRRKNNQLPVDPGAHNLHRNSWPHKRDWQYRRQPVLSAERPRALWPFEILFACCLSLIAGAPRLMCVLVEVAREFDDDDARHLLGLRGVPRIAAEAPGRSDDRPPTTSRPPADLRSPAGVGMDTSRAQLGAKRGGSPYDSRWPSPA